MRKDQFMTFYANLIMCIKDILYVEVLLRERVKPY